MYYQPDIDFDAFLKPKSIAVIGATERSTWGNWVIKSLLTQGFPGKVYPVNPNVEMILNSPCYPTVKAIEGPVDLAIIAIPADYVFDSIRDCAAKGVKASIIITAGFSEAVTEGSEQEQKIVSYAHAHGMRIVGPNVSGIINLHADLLAQPANRAQLCMTPVAFIAQGGYAVGDLAAHEVSSKRGYGKFLHTGNEADIEVTDFLEYLEHDPDTRVICMYIEGIRDVPRFREVARRVSPKKPIVLFKGGVTPDGGRAAASHTGAMAGSKDIYRGLFRQSGVVSSPSFELMLCVAHAFLEHPPLKQGSIGIITYGGSWGVMLTDALVRQGLSVPELSADLQTQFRRMGMPDRASVRNPLDIGAAHGALRSDHTKEMISVLARSTTIGGLVIHGFGKAGTIDEGSSEFERKSLEQDMELVRWAHKKQKEYQKPILFCSLLNQQQSSAVRIAVGEGIPFYERVDDVAAVLNCLAEYGKIHPNGERLEVS